jgi:hypothetical protein
MGEISAAGRSKSKEFAPLLSSQICTALSPHGRCRVSLVRHDEENKVTAKLDAGELGCHCKLSSATSDQIWPALSLSPHFNTYTSMDIHLSTWQSSKAGTDKSAYHRLNMLAVDLAAARELCRSRGARSLMGIDF